MVFKGLAKLRIYRNTTYSVLLFTCMHVYMYTLYIHFTLLFFGISGPPCQNDAGPYERAENYVEYWVDYQIFALLRLLSAIRSLWVPFLRDV
jgi:hypothetical protein